MNTHNLSSEGGRLVEAPAGCSVLSEKPFIIKNSFASHPLFEEARLKRLLRTLPREHIEIRAVQTVETNDGGYRRVERLTDADPVDTFERLGEQTRWMLVHKCWLHDPEYAEMMKQFVRDLSETVADVPDKNGLSDLGCWLVFSSPGCVVHFHADPDQSFLNQIRGTKTVHLYPAKVISEPVLEKITYTQDQGIVPYQPEYEASAFPPTLLVPGESVFLPLFAPHRVTNGDDVSISLNVGFQIPHSRGRNALHNVNFELRRLGLQPAPYNQRPAIDSIKKRMLLLMRVKNRVFKFMKPKVTQ